MKSEIVAANNARRVLQEAGYPVVRTQRPFDFVAWATDADGALAPTIAVEVKTHGAPETALPILKRARDTVGTIVHYAVINNQWYEAAEGLRSLHAVDGPKPPLFDGGILRDPDLVKDLLLDEAASLRRHIGESPQDVIGAFLDRVRQSRETQKIAFSPGVEIVVDSSALTRGARLALGSLPSRSRDYLGMHTTPRSVTDLMVSLARGMNAETVLDPFCGSGELLWTLADSEASQGTCSRYTGIDIDPLWVEASKVLADDELADVTLQLGDSFTADFGTADLVISTLPALPHGSTSHALLNGEITRDRDAIIVDRCLRALNEGGRVVLQLLTRFATNTRLEKYREYLSENYRIAALIGLPPGGYSGTRIESIVMVIENKASTDTFIAQLDADWDSSPEMIEPVVDAAVAHIENVDDSQ